MKREFGCIATLIKIELSELYITYFHWKFYNKIEFLNKNCSFTTVCRSVGVKLQRHFDVQRCKIAHPRPVFFKGFYYRVKQRYWSSPMNHIASQVGPLFLFLPVSLKPALYRHSAIGFFVSFGFFQYLKKIIYFPLEFSAACLS